MSHKNRKPGAPAAPKHGALRLLVQAHALFGEGKLAEAAITARKAAAADPKFAEAWSDLGAILKADGRFDEAVEVCGKAIRLKPEMALAHSNLGLSLQALGRLDDAEIHLRRAAELDPGNAGALVELGVLLAQAGRLDAAVDVLRAATIQAPDWADAHGNLGSVLNLLGRSDEAIAALRQAIALDSRSAEAHCNLSIVLREQGRQEEAIPICRQAIVLKPDYAEAHNNLANCLQELCQDQAAAEAYRQAISFRPDYAEAYNNYALCLQRLGRLDEAIAACRRAIVLDPDSAFFRNNLGTLLFAQCRPSEALQSYEEAVAMAPNTALYYRNILSCAMYQDELDGAALAELHRRFGSAVGGVPVSLPARNLTPGRRLRIGYLSSDFRNHPISGNLLPVLERHDRRRFELHLYADLARLDTVSVKFRDLADGWVNIRGLTDQAVAERIRADGIDILVFLAGRFDRNRPEIAALRAAPVQISMHDVATSGLAEMDYIIADPWLLPRRTEEFFTERPLRMTYFYTAELPEHLVDIATERPEGPPVFGCFNNPSKVTPRLLALWGRILARLPQSRLVLKFLDSYGSADLRARFLEGLTAAGASAGQVEFIAGQKDPWDVHLSRYNNIDVALDTSPFSGSTTTYQALMMGVPVVTRPLDRMVSRWTAAMLKALDLEELIATDDEAYVALAVRVAEAAEQWRRRRPDIRARLAASPLIDPDRSTRQIERLYRAVWRRHCRTAQGVADVGIAALLDAVSRHHREGRLAEAIAVSRQVVVRHPDLASAHYNLGNLLAEDGKHADAVAAYERAVALKPDYVEALNNLGLALKRLGRAEAALGAWRKVITLAPGVAEAHANYGSLLSMLGRNAEAMASYERALAIRPADTAMFKDLISCAVYRDDFGAEELKEVHLRFGKTFDRDAPALAPRDPSPGRRLRVGYLSSDFREHPVAINLLPVIRAHDRDAVEVHLYADLEKVDYVTDFFRQRADGWHDVKGLSDREVAERVRADGIDILVCLAGHFDRNRLTVCAWRAAPVQINMHDVATSGLAEMDYIVADPWLLPRQTEEFFTETPLRLPHFYLAELPPALPDIRAERPAGPPVFGCFNNPSKITPRLLELWGRILARLPGSRLVLQYQDRYGSTELQHRFLRQLTAAGAAATQVEFLAEWASVDSFLARYNDIDVALDTFPFSGSTTSFQALTMGVPVVTRPLDRMVSRWSAAMLKALDLDELIAEDDESYLALAVRVAEAAEVWRGRRPDIRARLASSPLTDGKRWARQIERLYRAAWRRHCLAAAPVSVDADADAERLLAEVVAFHGEGRLAEAASSLERLLVLNPGLAGGWSDLGGILKRLGRRDEAVAAYRQAVAREPGLANVHADLGALLYELGRLDQAMAAYRRALLLKPNSAATHSNLGVALQRLGRVDEAAGAYRRALALDDGLASAHANLGMLLLQSGRLDEAESHYRRAVALEPDVDDARVSLANVLLALGHPAEATEIITDVVARQPNHAAAHNTHALCLREAHRHEEAIVAWRRALALDPSLVEAHSNLGAALTGLGRCDEATACLEAAIAVDGQNVDAFRNLLTTIVYRDDLGADALGTVARRFGRAFQCEFDPLPPRDHSQTRRLRIGYLSADLRKHSVATNLLPAMRGHDRQAMELHFYADIVRPDATTEAFRGLADGWHDIAGLSDRAVAERIRADGIDILVSLAGRFDRNRPVVCAWRAAPVQISMHDVATSGLTEMDYIVADPWLLPRRTEEFFAEKPLRLPHFYLAELPDDLPDIVDERPSRPPVFGCFNNPSKITPRLLALWGRILAAAPGSRLVLRYRGFYASKDLRERFLGALTAAGAAAGQVEFPVDRDTRSNFLARYNDIDVALDTFPFSGSTTSFEALAMGVPVVTRPLDRMVSRWSAALLRALDLEELIAEDDEAYVALAVRVAEAAEVWRGRRPDIRARLAASPLTDGRRWARQMERLYRAVWRRWCRGVAPASDTAEAKRLAVAAMEHQRAGRLAEAVDLYGRAVAFDPGYADAYCNLGAALRDLGRLEDAVAAYRSAIAAAPTLAEPWSNLGEALLDLGVIDEAVSVCRQAVALAPRLAAAHGNLGAALAVQGRHIEAAASYETALSLEPGSALAHNNLATALFAQGRHAEAAQSYENALAIGSGTALFHRNILSSAMYQDELDGAVLAEMHRRFGRAFDRDAPPLALRDPSPERRLKIGYLSSDFHDHPVAGNLLPVIQRHDRARFDVYFYADLVRMDQTSVKFRDLAAGWTNIHGLSDQAVAERIRADGIDILVLLAGRFDRNRPEIAAQRAAPIQISMHDVATSGLAAMDYIIADPWLLPRRTEEFFTETPLRLPHFYVAEFPADLPDIGTERPAGPPVFGCFNNPAKITARVSALWGRVLARLPGSRLVLQYQDRYASAEIRMRFVERLVAGGALAGQIEFRPERLPLADFLARYNDIDVALDTSPFSGSTTSFQALAMGVPVVTRPLDRMVSRWSAAMLKALDLDELIATDDESYVALAVRVAEAAEVWRGRRPDIRARLASSPLTDGKRWARQIERLYRAAWRRHCGDAAPKPPTADIERLRAEMVSHYGAGRLPETISVLEQLLALDPGFAEGWSDLGALRKALGRLDEAVAAYRQAVAVKPGLAMAHSNLSTALLDLGQIEEAIAAAGRAIAADPALAAAHYNLGNALAQAGRLDEAVTAYGEAARLAPGDALIHANLGFALKEAGRLSEAERACRLALHLDPRLIEGHVNLGFVLQEQGQSEAALASWNRAVEINPDRPEAYGNLGAAYHDLALPAKADEYTETALRLRPEDPKFHRDLLSSAIYRDDLDSAALAAVHRRFGRVFGRLPAPLPPHDTSPGRRLRIGYLSSDFRRHPVSGNLLPVLRQHDRRLVELHFYADLLRPDSVTEEFRSLADGWHDITGLADEAVADRIRADGIDILVCLAGHFDRNRPTVCAWRAAPVQISMHDVATSGLAEMDYFVADPWLLPRQTEEFFTETPLRLPHFYVADLPADLPDIATARPKGSPVFGCFNNPSKITPSMLALWGRILALLPGSRLVLKYQDRYGWSELRERFLVGITRAGAAASQVEFPSGGQESFADFLARYNDIDVALDTSPFSGSTTSFQALTMGVPVVTRPVDRMVSRWTAALLKALDLDELIATDDESYVALAVRVAEAAELWRGRRIDIRARLASSPLTDGKRWARQIERLYRAVWRRHCQAVRGTDGGRLDALLDTAESRHRQGRLGESATAYQQALSLDSGHVVAHNNLGVVLRKLGRLDEAVASCRQAIAIDPNRAEAHANLGDVLRAQGRLAEALAAWRNALALNSGLGDVHNSIGAALMETGRPIEALASFDRACRLQPTNPRYFRNVLTSAMYRDDLDLAQLAELHRRFGGVFGTAAVCPIRDPDPNRRLRIGLLSSDLRHHPVAANLLPGLRAHDHSALELHAYATFAEGNRPDAVTDEFKRAVEFWHDVSELDDRAVAERIRADGIDILVSLAGRFDRNRPSVCAWRAAPVQISLYDAATSGLEAMDYLLADPWLVPRGSPEFFTERVLRLPQLFVYDPPTDFPPLRADRAAGPPVFGCFNNPSKITPSMLALWGRILALLPGSRLVLKYQDRYGWSELRERFLAEITRAGAAASQVEFPSGGQESFAAFLARYNDIDVALDTSPFSGSTTSFQALAMGVPVVTRPLDRMVSRWSAAMLKALDLDELIATDDESYVALAVRVAEAAEAWRGRRPDIRARLAASPLTDGKRWARQMERLYRAVWRRKCGVPAPVPAATDADRLRAEAAARYGEGRLVEAVSCLERLLAIRPGFGEGWSDLGVMLKQLGRADEAMAAYRRAIAVQPGLAGAHVNLGVALQELGRLDEAVAAYRRALMLRPDSATALSNLGVALLALGRAGEAEQACRRAVALRPDLAEAHDNLANALRAGGRLDEAIAAWRQAISLRPDFARARKNLSMGLLLKGEYREGWAAYEDRWADPDAQPRGFLQPRWDGAPLASRTILCHGEQGLGDAIQFVRFVPAVVAAGGRVVLQVPRQLVGLMAGIPGVSQVLAKDEPTGPFDVHIPLMSLPLLLGTTVDTIPAEIPYLSVPDDLSLTWRRRLPSSGFRVGIAWAGNPTHPDDRLRSIPLASFSALAALPGVHLISLQKGHGLEQLDNLPEGMVVDRLGAEYDAGTFLDTAAVVANLDLVVAADTSVAHLAGALGRPVWIGLPPVPDWRWLLERDDSPWYPTATLFRRRMDGDWNEVLARMATRLGSHLGGNPLSQAVRAHQAGDHGAALEWIDAAVAANSESAPVHATRALILRALGRVDEAIESLRLAIELAPDNPVFLYNLGNALIAAERLGEAADAYRRAVTLAPDTAEFHNGLGEALRLADDGAAAIGRFTEAIHLRPDYAEAHNGLGATHYDRRELDAAAACYREAIRLRPDHVEARKNLGAVLFEMGDQGGALEQYRGVIAIAPDYAEAHFHLGCTLLRQGDFAEGWAEYEWRRRLPGSPSPIPGLAEWRGEDLAGRTILLYGEQGLGDVIQFARYATLLAERGAKVVLGVRRPLARLMTTVPGVSLVIAESGDAPPLDFQAPLLSLPWRLGTELATIPASVPYVFAEDRAARAWRRRLGGRKGLKVGLVWSGDPRPHDRECAMIDRRRSLALAQFAPLAGIAGIRFVSLQKGPGAAQLASAPAGLEVADFMADIDDFADTAALIANLDLVITVDTSVAHLAGAMGTPVWILSRFDGCWRWLLGRYDSPWYPSARLFRQEVAGDWAPALEALANRLRMVADDPALLATGR